MGSRSCPGSLANVFSEEGFARCEKKQLYIAVVVCALVCLAPLLLYSNDIWDGTIISYAFETANPKIFQTWFGESGSPLGALLYESAYWLFGGWGVAHKLVINAVMFLLVVVCAIQIYHIGRNSFGFRHEAALVSSLVYVANPSWYVLVSSVFLSLVVWNFFILSAIRLLTNQESIAARLVGIVLLCVSFHYAANPALAMPLLLFVFIGLGQKEKNLAGLLVLLLGFIYFVVFRYYFSASDLYSGYNEITYKHLVDADVYLNFFEFLVRCYWPLLPLLLLSIFKARDFKFYIGLLYLSITLVCTVIPFVTVNKVVTGELDWSGRVTVNLTIALCFLLGLVVSKLYEVGFRRAPLILVIGLLINTGYWLYAGYEVKIREKVYQDYFVTALEEYGDLKPGLVYTKSLSFYAPDSYEYNYYFYKAFGKASWFVNVEDDTATSALMTSRPEYRDKYIASDFNHQCTYKMETETNIQDVSGWKLWMYYFVDNGYFDGVDDHVYVDVNIREIKCKQGDGLDYIDLKSDMVDIRLLEQQDIVGCSQFVFSKAKWFVAEPAVFPASCTVRFIDGARLEMKKDTYLVFEGKVYFPEAGSVSLSGASSSNGLNGWGGVLIKGVQAHVQYLDVTGAEGFSYNGNHFPAALNFEKSESSSVYRSNVLDSRVGLYVNGGSNYIHQSNISQSGVGVLVDNAAVKLVGNVISGSRISSIEMSSKAKLVFVRNVVEGEGAVFEIKGSSVVDAYYNLYMKGVVSSKIEESAKLSAENDVYFKAGAETALFDKEYSGMAVSGTVLDASGIYSFPYVSKVMDVSGWAEVNFGECEPCKKYLSLDN